ncbi:hypothetical protein L596_020381 [Steinernema carpocapsae]|nr:hypothetical protein L596_020381 [Steinernema carpocapsae]
MSEESSTGLRECTLQGNKSAVDKAREMIMDVLNSAWNQTPPARNGGGYNDGGSQNEGNRGPPAPEGQTTQEMLIPGLKCGLIIGKSGVTIKAIQEQTGVKMLLIQGNSKATGVPKPLRISGDPVKVKQARRMVEKILQSKKEVFVPSCLVGEIIGKDGEAIKKLEKKSGATIHIKRDDVSNAPDRYTTIQGSPDQIIKATQLISDLVKKIGGGKLSEVFFMHVPADKTGLVIGQGGETIKKIIHESKAHVELFPDPLLNGSENVFIIKGSRYEIYHAQQLITTKIGVMPADHGSR